MKSKIYYIVFFTTAIGLWTQYYAVSHLRHENDTLRYKVMKDTLTFNSGFKFGILTAQTSLNDVLKDKHDMSISDVKKFNQNIWAEINNLKVDSIFKKQLIKYLKMIE
jgi:hypothetical protein